MVDPDDTYTTDPHTRMTAEIGAEPSHPDDLDREGRQGEPPVPGAQWDELHGRWERWDEAAQEWVVVGDDPGDAVPPSEENPLPALLARELLHAEELEAEHEPLTDIGRAAEPTTGPTGAQWNEVEQRWERWDDAAGDWVEVADDAPSD